LLEAQNAFEVGKAELEKNLGTFRDEIVAAQTALAASHAAAQQQFADGATAVFAKCASDFDAAELARKATYEARSAEADEAFSKMTTGYDDELKATAEAVAEQIKISTARPAPSRS
jgi:hypothetical protein